LLKTDQHWIYIIPAIEKDQYKKNCIRDIPDNF